MSLELKGEHLPENDDSKPIFVAIMDNGKLTVIRMPTELGDNPDVHDYMNEKYSHDLDWMVIDNLENIKLDNHMNHNLRVGDLVISNSEMNEADFMDCKVWIHAKKGDVGFVEHITDDGYPTIRFNETGTATICHVDELVILKNVDNIPLFDKEIDYNVSVLTDMLVK